MVLTFATLVAIGATPDGSCDPKVMKDVRALFAEVGGVERAEGLVLALAEACESRLPGSVAGSVKAIGVSSPESRTQVTVEMLSANASFAKLACADWAKLGPGAAKLQPAKLYASCKLEKLGLLTVDEFAQSWNSGGFALLAVSLYAWLVDKNMEPAEAKRLARAMLPGRGLK